MRVHDAPLEEEGTLEDRGGGAAHATNGERCHSLPTLLDELATRTRNTIRLRENGATFAQLTKPTLTQARALALIKNYAHHVVTTDPATVARNTRQQA